MNLVFYLVAFAVGMLFVHLFKLLRLYLVLMERDIPFYKFVYIYMETTCINLIIPFKLGEIYRVLRLAIATGKFWVGLLSVVTDRFFDTAALLMLLIVLRVLGATGGEIVILVLLCIVAILVFAYIAFPETHKYLNRYLIINKTSKRSMMALEMLDRCNEVYEYVNGLVRGRSALMIVCSLLGWVAEGLTLKALSQILGETYGISEYANYIGAIFAGSDSSLYRSYIMISVVVVGVITVLWTLCSAVLTLRQRRCTNE